MGNAMTAASGRTGLDLSHEKIIQFSLLVSDAEKVAKRFSEIFGVSWKFYDMQPKQIQLRDKTLEDSDCRLKIALGAFGGRSLKLVQPLSGQNSYAEFLQKHGEGFYTVGLGTLLNHDDVVSKLKKAGVLIEMQGDLETAPGFQSWTPRKNLGAGLRFPALPIRHIVIY